MNLFQKWPSGEEGMNKNLSAVCPEEPDGTFRLQTDTSPTLLPPKPAEQADVAQSRRREHCLVSVLLSPGITWPWWVVSTGSSAVTPMPPLSAEQTTATGLVQTTDQI